MKTSVLALISLTIAQGPPESVLGSIEASQAAISSLEFIIRAPGNCLQALPDLPTSASKNMAALWLRAAFHDAGTWSPGTDNPAGLDSSLMSFLDNNLHSGLKESVAPNFVQNRAVQMTNSDKIALGAQVAMTHCGGPKIPFKVGRKDTTKPTTPIGLIPSGESTLDQTRVHFKRMGWTNEDIVALVTGSHTMGGVHGKNSPEVTKEEFIPFDDTAGIFDNHVFKFTLQGKCAIQLDCDIANDPEMRPIVQRFADDQDAFFEQYKISFQKLLSQTKSELKSQDLEFSVHDNLEAIEQPGLNFQILDVFTTTNVKATTTVQSTTTVKATNIVESTKTVDTTTVSVEPTATVVQKPKCPRKK
jgi:L-ascorbate peroxidase